ncbi:Monooxygenase, FAD-binding [Ectocarpus siliculosus]|uniref:Monooxygenase, FAD-binding n=1 Tax=Ectocarpus siliculosus TaxID=2880 RepID=D8LLN1_ECTSI|nr:Monooxygenase, FAD-binding [Ectocarpus siliculosus]|eukprot:CBN74662.1 Monooxygenase, FAD-binding [Ectocarpus siliculosus]
MSATGSGAAAPEGAVIVGGGPSGLATALMLAKRGWSDISVIERTPSADYFDPRVAFVYQIDRRGQFFLDAHGLTEKLAEVSVDTREFTITRIPADGDRKELSLPIIDNTRPTAYWLPRSVFQQLLYSEVESKYPEQIKVFYSHSCDSIERLPEGGGIEVRASPHASGGGDKEGGDQKVFRPRLLVGADGLKSTVRQQLRAWDEEEQKQQDPASGKKPAKQGRGRFDMRKQPSGSSGLRYKVLSLAPSFLLGNDDDARAESQKAYAVLSKFQDAKRVIRIGILPWGPPGGDRENRARGGNFITLPGHPLWDLKTGDEVKAYLAETFPQIPVAKEIGDKELVRFAESKGGRFPDPQYCPGLYWLVKGSKKSQEEGDGGGAALVGDAIHAFPPDLGQGVNSALEDVIVLERALASCGDRVEDALPEYERTRAADSKALVRLCQIGYPWQYKQPYFFKPKLWTANFLLRTFFLNKILPKIFGQQVFMMIQTRYDMPYSKILADTDRTTRRIWGTAIAIALAIVFRQRLDVAVRTLASTAFSLFSSGAAV